MRTTYASTLRRSVLFASAAAALISGRSGVDAASRVLVSRSAVVQTHVPHNVWTKTFNPLFEYGFEDCTAVAIGTKLYIEGGVEGDGPVVPTMNNQIYDSVTQTWSFGARIPDPRGQGKGGTFFGGATSIGGLLYYVGGTDLYLGPSDSLRVYDPATNTWQLRAPLPLGVIGPAVAQVRGMLYSAGGVAGNDRFHGQKVTNAVHMYDPALDRWTRIAPMPTARDGAAAVESGGLLYVIGGYLPDNTVTNVVEAYHPATQTWTEMPPMPTARGDLSAGVLDGIIYAEGGYGSRSRESAVVGYRNEAFDPMTNTWTERLPLPRARGNACGTGFNGQIYVIGGGGISSYNELSYTP